MINKPKGYDEIEENEVVEGVRVKIGPQPVQIKEVIDNADKQYLEIHFDFCQGEYKNYVASLKENTGAENWPNIGIYRASYKETATKFFKAFITAVQKSNNGYVWNWNEQTLKGKYFVANMGEEEYEKDGEIKVTVKIREPRSIEAWQKGEIKTPELKKLKKKPEDNNNSNDPFANLFIDGAKPVSDDDLDVF